MKEPLPRSLIVAMQLDACIGVGFMTTLTFALPELMRRPEPWAKWLLGALFIFWLAMMLARARLWKIEHAELHEHITGGKQWR